MTRTTGKNNDWIKLLAVWCAVVVSLILIFSLTSCRTLHLTKNKSRKSVDSSAQVQESFAHIKKIDSVGSILKHDSATELNSHDYERKTIIEEFEPPHKHQGNYWTQHQIDSMETANEKSPWNEFHNGDTSHGSFRFKGGGVSTKILAIAPDGTLLYDLDGGDLIKRTTIIESGKIVSEKTESKDRSQNTNLKKQDDSTGRTAIEINVKKKEDVTQIQKKVTGFNFLNILWLLVIAAAYLIYKNRDRIKSIIIKLFTGI